MIYVFGACALDTQRYELRRADQVIRLRRKVFQVLTYLLAHPDRLVSKQEICAQVWPQQFVSEAALENTLKAVRQAIGDSGREQRLIQTVYGMGYRVIAAVERHAAVPRIEGAASTPPVPAGARESAPMRTDTAPGPTLPADATGDGEGTLVLGQAVPTAERKVVTVLCCALAADAGRSTPPDRDALYNALRSLYTVAHTAVAEYGGTLQPLVGEHVIAVFGAPVAQEDHAPRAVWAALALQQHMAEQRAAPDARLGHAVPVRIGLDTGWLAVGDIDDSPAGGITVVGSSMQRAMGLQARAVPGRILCSEATARLVQGVVRVEPAGPVSVAGESAPVVAYTVLGRRLLRRPHIHRERRLLTPFVGRARELKALRALWAQALDSRGQVVGVVGEPGMGKSRLVFEFQQHLHGTPVTYLAAGCLSHGTATPYLPVLALLQHNCGVTERDALAAITAKVEESLDEVGLAPGSWSPFLLQLLGVPISEDVLAPLSPQAVKARTIEALVQLALHGARRRPLVLEIENLHWIDPSSEEVLTALVERLAGARILLLLTYRPGYQPLWITKSYATQLSLVPLAPRASRRVVQAVVHTGRIPEAVVQAILARAGGNPFFLEELSRTAMEQQDSQRTVGVPTTIQAVLAARIDRLPPEAKHVLQVAAVIGKDVTVPLLEAIVGVSEDALQRGLAHLQAVELLYERTRAVDRAVTFKHILIQETAYQSLLQSTRWQYHQQIAQILETRFPEVAASQPERLAHHWTEAGRSERAVVYWQRAGQQALQRSANLEAVRHLTTALELLATLPDTPERTQQELALQTSLGPALMDSKGFAAPEVEHVYARARELCRQIGDTPQLFPVLRGLWVFYFVGGKHETARELAEQLLTLAQDYHAPDLLLEASRAVGCTLFYLGEFVSARAHLEQGIALYDPLQHRSHAFLYGEDPGVGCRAFAARALWCLGYPDQALQRSYEALTLARELAQPFSLSQAQSFAAWLRQFRREVLLTQQQAEAAMTSATELGFPAWLGQGLILHGWALAMQGQGAEGIAQIHQGLSARQTTGADLARSYWLALLAEIYGEVGQAEEGLRVLSEAFTVVRRAGERWWEAELYRLKGELLLALAQEHQAEAETCFHQALEIARCQHAKSLELRAAMSLARLWQRQGKRADAYDLLAPIYGWFTEGFDTADLQEAKALLDALSVVHASPAVQGA